MIAKLIYPLVFVIFLCTHCTDSKICTDFPTQEELKVFEGDWYVCDDLGNREVNLQAFAPNAKQLNLDCSWMIDGVSFEGDNIHLSGRGTKAGTLTISNIGCSMSMAFEIDMDQAAGTIGSRVWYEKDYTDEDCQLGQEALRANQYDPCDDPLENIIVELISAKSQTVMQRDTTDSDGQYLFTKVPEGEYQLKFGPVESFLKFVEKDSGDDDTIDSDVDANGYTDVFYFGECQIDMTLNAGLTLQ